MALPSPSIPCRRRVLLLGLGLLLAVGGPIPGALAAVDLTPPTRDRAHAEPVPLVPSEVTVEYPTTRTIRTSVTTHNGNVSLEVGYSYDEANPDSTEIRFDDGNGNVATYKFEDDYAGDNTVASKLLDLTAPDDAKGNGFVDGNTYNVIVEAINESEERNSASVGGVLEIDDTAPEA